MAGAVILIDIFVRGVGVGLAAATGLALMRNGPGRQVQVAGGLLILSTGSWLITDSATLWSAFGEPYLLAAPAYCIASLFWVFVLSVFDDRREGAIWLAVVATLGLGLASDLLWRDQRDWLWTLRSVLNSLFLVHAAVVIVSSWSGDLVEQRRRLRAPALLLATGFGLTSLTFSIFSPPPRDDLVWTAGYPFGAIILVAILALLSTVFLEARHGAFGAPSRAATPGDHRAEAADRVLAERLAALMAGAVWRREGLTIGALARELGEPEHRLRRLINQRLGHRNFADFLNGYRVEAAMARLRDAREARTNIAVVAFDLGYGSLRPFNRAFKTKTGLTPTEWRRRELGALRD